MPKVDLIVHSATQVATCAGGVRRGASLADVALVADGAVAISDGVIVAVGRTADILADCAARELLDASGRAVCPGFVDAHTHTIYAGERIGEFELRIRGASYMDIMAAGGGILSTMHHTRQATPDDLAAQCLARLDVMLSLGTTTVEIKTGYGLDLDSELKMLRAAELLHQRHAVAIVPTFLGAHAIPPELGGRADEYVDLVVEEMIPAAAEWYGSSVFAAQGIPLFCDVFCEQGAFDRAQAERVLRAGLAHGMAAKLHADEFKNLGGASLAVELGATSVDHLDVTPPAEIERLAASDVVGVVLPAVNFNFGSAHYAPARQMADAGVILALASDFNPGSAPCPSMPLVMAIACRYQRLLPAESLNASTVNAAAAVGLASRLGSLEPGKQADLLVLNCPDYRYLAYQFGSNPVERVIKAGRVC